MITIDHNVKKVTLPPLVKINEVKKFLSVSRHTVYNLIDSGDLEAAELSSSNKARKHVRVTSKSLETFYKKRFGHSLVRALAHAYEP